jgi:hypothetical protein
VKCVLLLSELKSYTHVRSKFNQVDPDETAPIYRSVVRWNKRLKETGSVLRQHGPARHTASQDIVKRISEASKWNRHNSVRRTVSQLRLLRSTVHDVLLKD